MAGVSLSYGDSRLLRNAGICLRDATSQKTVTGLLIRTCVRLRRPQRVFSTDLFCLEALSHKEGGGAAELLPPSPK
jgi:hypothetical protein